MIDALRARFPTLAFAVYALDPGGAVTFEVHDDGEVFTFSAPTEGAAIELAFPPVLLPDEPSIFD